LPRTLIKRAGMESIRLRVQVSNVMLWKANKFGIDPEFHDATGGSTSGQVGGGIRYLRANQGALTLGLNIRF
jgi:hypothetical protein